MPPPASWAILVFSVGFWSLALYGAVLLFR